MKEEKKHRPKPHFFMFLSAVMAFPLSVWAFIKIDNIYLRYFTVYFLLILSCRFIINSLKKFEEKKTIKCLISLIPLNILISIMLSELLSLGFMSTAELSINLKIISIAQILYIILLRVKNPDDFILHHQKQY